ncbi:MAG: type II secretion system minor pseudopilin GspI [Blastomonas sp.]
MRSTRSRPARANGFSLLEMMVALAVFAIAALALVKLQGASVMQTAELDSRLYTEIAARNLAVEIMTDPMPPALGDSSGEIANEGRVFLWQRSTSKLPDSDLLKVELSVRQASGSMVTLMLVRGGA